MAMFHISGVTTVRVTPYEKKRISTWQKSIRTFSRSEGSARQEALLQMMQIPGNSYVCQIHGRGHHLYSYIYI